MQFNLNQLLPSLQTRETTLVTFGPNGRRETPFCDVYKDVTRAMAFMTSRGVRAGQRVGIVARNCYEWCVADLACIGIGAVLVAFDSTGTHEVDARIDQYQLALLLLGNETPPPCSARACSLRDVVSGPDPAQPDMDIAPHEFAPGSVLSIKFTSGSTGDSKPMEVWRESVEDTISSVQEIFQHDAADRVLLFLPLHLIQQRYWIYMAIFYGVHVILCPPELAMGVLRKERPTVVMGIPGFFETLQKSYLVHTPAAEQCAAHFQAHLGGAIRYLWTGSAPVSHSTLEFFESMGVPLYQGYGTNETCIVSKNYPGHNRVGSAGPLLPHREIKFDHVGQILVRPRHPVADRYLDAPVEVSRGVFLPDGFIATGDIGELDADGYLHIRGRIKDVIVLSSGIKVNPHYVESCLKAHADVLSCFVHGDARPYLVALLCVRPGGMSRADIAALIARVNTGLAPHQHIYAFDMLDEEFSIENGLLNAQLKMRRDRILHRHRDRITALYKGDG
jgi:long-subunit acyl-CoA synthetase (AMP-forming)